MDTKDWLGCILKLTDLHEKEGKIDKPGLLGRKLSRVP